MTIFPDVEAVIPVIEKDLNKLPYVINRLYKHIRYLTYVHVVTPDPGAIKDNLGRGVAVHADQDVFPFDASKFKFRPNWVYQQFIKLFQDVTDTRWFISCDADLFVNRDLPLFGPTGKPRLFRSRDPNQRIGQYAKFNAWALGDDYKPLNFAIMNDIALYNRGVIDALLSYLRTDRITFADRASGVIANSIFPAEAELYGNWVNSSKENYPFDYEFLNITNGWCGMYGDYSYTKEEVERILSEHPTADTVSIHTWK